MVKVRTGRSAAQRMVKGALVKGALVFPLPSTLSVKARLCWVYRRPCKAGADREQNGQRL